MGVPDSTWRITTVRKTKSGSSLSAQVDDVYGALVDTTDRGALVFFVTSSFRTGESGLVEGKKVGGVGR